MCLGLQTHRSSSFTFLTSSCDSMDVTEDVFTYFISLFLFPCLCETAVWTSILTSFSSKKKKKKPTNQPHQKNSQTQKQTNKKTTHTQKKSPYSREKDVTLVV